MTDRSQRRRRWIGPTAAVAAPSLVAASPAVAQTLGQGAPDGVPWVRLAAALLLCLGLAVGAVSP